jgi:xanthine phosphoribosyltransferase
LKLLQDRILKEGKVFPGNILKVDSFLNHQLDPNFIKEIGAELARRFSDQKITKIVTIEASGIAVAIMTGLELNVPVIFAKKHKSANMGSGIFNTTVKSYTRNTEFVVSLSKEYLNADDKVLIIDDFLAVGQAALGLVDIVRQSGASLTGIGIVIEKGFMDGGKLLRQQGIRVESLSVIKSFQDNQVIFED